MKNRIGKLFEKVRSVDSWLLVALSIYLVFIVFSPDFVLGALSAHDIEFRLSDIFLLGLIGYLIYMVFTGKKTLTLSRIFFPALAFVGTFFLGAIVAFFKLGGSRGLEATFFAVKYFEYFLIFFVTFSLVYNEKQIEFLLKWLLWLASISGILLIISKWVSKLHLTLTIDLPSFVPRYHHLYHPRATLPFARGFGPSAEFLVLVLPLALFFFIYSEKVYKKGIYLSFSAILGLALILTSSRGPMAALFMAIILLVPFLEKKLVPWLMAGLVGATGLYYVAPFFHQRVNSFLIVFSGGICANNSMCARVTRIWPEGLKQFLNHPIFGKGVASFPTSDTQYIRLLADQGIIGLSAFVIFIATLIFYLIQVRNLSRENKIRLIFSSAFIVSVVALLINGITATAFEPVRAMEPFWFLLGLVFAFEKFEDYESIGSPMEVNLGR